MKLRFISFRWGKANYKVIIVSTLDSDNFSHIHYSFEDDESDSDTTIRKGCAEMVTKSSDMFHIFLTDYKVILFVVLMSFALALMLKSMTAFLVQVALFVAIIIVDQTAIIALYIPMVVIQIAVALFLLYRLIVAIDRNYQLILEKTHQMHPEITKNRNSGTQRSFLRND